MKFTKTEDFRPAAAYYEKHSMYTPYAKGTLPYVDYWKEEDFRCRHGFEANGFRITGPHYFYLNFVQILSKNEETGRKTKNFPRFLDIDFDFFHIIERAREEKKGVILVKPRRTGFSYKNAAIVTHEYNFYRDSQSLIGSNPSMYGENTMKMVLDNLNFLNKETEWIKPRNPDTRDHIMARHQIDLDGVKVWKGYMSDVKCLSFKDNPSAAIGRSCSLFLWEEAGKFDNLIQAFNLAEPCWKDGEDTIGIPIIYGTGGDMEGGTRDFHEMFFNPEKYNLLSFKNIWESGKEETTCGWFLPSTRGRLGSIEVGGKEIKFREELVDKDGNSNEELSLKTIEKLREIKNQGKDANAIRDAITQYPLTPNEAFLRTKGNVFPTAELQEHLANIETSAELRSKGQKGELYFDAENKLKWKLNTDLNAIVDFPLKKDHPKEGAIVIWEHPEFVMEANPYGLYIAGCDPYDQDKAESSESLGSFFIYKTFYSADRTSYHIVAEFTGRPERADDFYETCRRLCMYYNSKCLYENQLKGLKNYFLEKHCLHYLHEQPNNMIKDIIKDSKVQRGYGIHMNRGSQGATGIKDQCEIYLKQWLLDEKQDINGRKILNLHTVLSIPLLKELIAYDREGNYDRVIAVMLCILQAKEIQEVYKEGISGRKRLVDEDPFFRKSYFTKHKLTSWTGDNI
jgi:hypothetical protein